MAKKDEEELRERIEKLEFERALNHAIKVRCAAFWSGIVLFSGALGSWASANLIAIKAGFKAFWDVWGAK